MITLLDIFKQLKSRNIEFHIEYLSLDEMGLNYQKDPLMSSTEFIDKTIFDKQLEVYVNPNINLFFVFGEGYDILFSTWGEFAIETNYTPMEDIDSETIDFIKNNFIKIDYDNFDINIFNLNYFRPERKVLSDEEFQKEIMKELPF